MACARRRLLGRITAYRYHSISTFNSLNTKRVTRRYFEPSGGSNFYASCYQNNAGAAYIWNMGTNLGGKIL
jgi:hypothetical protein